MERRDDERKRRESPRGARLVAVLAALVVLGLAQLLPFTPWVDDEQVVALGASADVPPVTDPVTLPPLPTLHDFAGARFTAGAASDAEDTLLDDTEQPARLHLRFAGAWPR